MRSLIINNTELANFYTIKDTGINTVQFPRFSTMVIYTIEDNTEFTVERANRRFEYATVTRRNKTKVLPFGASRVELSMYEGGMEVMVVQDCTSMYPLWKETVYESDKVVRDSTVCVVASTPYCRSPVTIGARPASANNTYVTDGETGLISEETAVRGPKWIVMRIREADSFFINLGECAPRSTWNKISYEYDTRYLSRELFPPTPLEEIFMDRDRYNLHRTNADPDQSDTSSSFSFWLWIIAAFVISGFIVYINDNNN